MTSIDFPQVPPLTQLGTAYPPTASSPYPGLTCFVSTRIQALLWQHLPSGDLEWMLILSKLTYSIKFIVSTPSEKPSSQTTTTTGARDMDLSRRWCFRPTWVTARISSCRTLCVMRMLRSSRTSGKKTKIGHSRILESPSSVEISIAFSNGRKRTRLWTWKANIWLTENRLMQCSYHGSLVWWIWGTVRE